MSVVYHVNPETGKTGVCKARVMCKFGVAYNEHFGTQEEAASSYEFKMESEHIDVDRNVAVLSKILKVSDRVGGFDPMGSVLDDIEAVDSSEWSDVQKHNLHALMKVSDLVERGVTDESKPEIDRAFSRFKGKDSLSGSLSSAGHYLYIQKVAESLPRDEWVPSRKVNEGLPNLSDSQRAVVRMANGDYGYNPDRAYIYEDAERDINSAIDRVVYGEQYPNIDSEYEHEGLIPKRDRLTRILSTENEHFSNKLYMGTVFPDNELKAAMDKRGVKDVETSTFYNNREWGMVYTVKEPSGNTRSFSVYQHRNSDNVIINGKTNWSGGDELPYVRDSKSAYLVESHPDNREEVAEILAAYMSSAQKGELQSDEDLSNEPIALTKSFYETGFTKEQIIKFVQDSE